MVTHHLILGGDFNCALSPVLDRSSPRKVPASKSAHLIQHFLKTYGIADMWRFCNPTTRSYSFFSPVHNSYSQIDYFFVDTNLFSSVTECDYEAIILSDHSPLTLTIHIPTTQPSYCPWRLNPALLSNEAFVNYITSEIESFLSITVFLNCFGTILK